MIDPGSHTGRVLSLLADGKPRTSHEISEAVDLKIDRVASITSRLNGAAWLKDQTGGARRRPKVWAITDLGRTRLGEAMAEKAGRHDDDGGLVGQIADMYAADNFRLAKEARMRSGNRDQLDEILREHVNYWDHDHTAAVGAVLAAGWRPPAQVIETPANEGDYTAAIAALDALPHRTVVRVRNHVYQSIGSGWWDTVGRHRSFSTEQVIDVADGDEITVLYVPTEKAGTE